MDVQTIADGLWRWTALHPDWTPKADWDEEVASFYVESEGDVVLVDPLVPDDDRDRKRFLDALDRDVERAGAPAIVLTVFWHERSATELAERYAGATVWSYAPTLDRLEGNVTNPFAVADPLPGGIRAIDADGEEAVLGIPDHHALAVGDVLHGDAEGGVRVAPDDWFAEGTDPQALRAAMRRLLELPIERILVGHGRPVLEAAHTKLEPPHELLFPDDQRGLWALATSLAAHRYQLSNPSSKRSMCPRGGDRRRRSSREPLAGDCRDDGPAMTVRYRLLDSIRVFASKR